MLPLVLLMAYGIAFASAALGTALLVFDDHPGQLYRAWHVLAHGPAPWAWNAGWWGGYPELQFYPPAAAYAVALLHVGSLGTLSLPAAYTSVLWLAYLAPGLTTFLALARVLGSGWAALPGAFVALTLSAGVASGVEGGVHAGMVAARLGWALLPLLLVALARWIEDDGRLPWLAIPVVAAVVLTHPAHLPAAVVLVLLAAAVAGPQRRARLLQALTILGVAAALTSFWTLPLMAHLAETRALAWGQLSLAGVGALLAAHPLAVVLVALAPFALRVRGRTARVAAVFPWVMVAVIALDAGALEPLGLRWLPADRVADSAWLGFVLATGAGIGHALRRLGDRAAARPPLASRTTVAAAALAVVAALALVALPGSTLALWPRPHVWPGYTETTRGLRLDDLWRTLAGAPEGRILFVRSGIPLVHGTEWWRPHTHLPALTPLRTGRAIVNGTFTHPSPVAALVYRGHAGAGAITRLVEQLDGHSLFGRPLETLDAATFNRYADALGVAAVVALDEDRPRLHALDDNPAFARAPTPSLFVLHVRRGSVKLPQPVGPGRWRIDLEGAAGAWTPARLAYYPLWRAEVDGMALPARRGDLGQLEVKLPRERVTVDLVYGPGGVERAGMLLSLLAAAGTVAVPLARRYRWLRSLPAGARD